MRTVDSCPACGKEDAVSVVQLDKLRRQRLIDYDQLKYRGLLSRWIGEIPVQILTCNICGHAWYHHQPEPEQLSLMYASGRTLSATPVLSSEPTDTMRKEMHRLRRLVGARPSVPQLLDYGSGRGRWARAALLEGFGVVAYEPSVERGAEANPPPFRLVHSRTDLANKRFDVINLEQVLEHIPDPMSELGEILGYCSSDAVVRIAVPNILRSPEGKALWDEWPFNGYRPHTMAPFEHLHGFTPRSLSLLLERSGFRFIAAHTLVANYPVTVLRQFVGKWVPRVAQTLALVTPR